MTFSKHKDPFTLFGWGIHPDGIALFWGHYTIAINWRDRP